MKVDTLAHVKNQFSTVIENLGKEPLFIIRNGKVAAVLQSLDDDEVEGYLMRNSPRFWRLIETRRRHANAGLAVPFDPASYEEDTTCRVVREKPAVYKTSTRRRARRRTPIPSNR